MDELIQVAGEGPEAPSPMGERERKIALGVAILSALVLVGTIAVDLAYPAPIAQPKGQEARDLAAANRSRNLWDGSAANWADTQLKTRSRVRRSLAPFWSAFLIDVLGTVPSDVVAGKEGWLFLRERVQPRQAGRDLGIERFAGSLAAIQRRLAGLGSEIIVLAIPRKAVAAAARLPEGMDADVEFDNEVFLALQSRGVQAIDVMEVWKELAPEDRYLRRDTHWATPGKMALTQAVADRFPELVTNEVDIEIVERTVSAPASLLNFAAIHRTHPAARWINRDTLRVASLRPASVVQRMQRGPLAVDVAMVGSSFTRHFDFAELMAARLGQVIYPGGIAGFSLGGSLAFFAGRFQQRELPRHVIFEVPIQQAMLLGVPSRSTRRTLTAFFAATSQVKTTPVPKALLGPSIVREKKARGVKVRFPEGTLLSTGDGVLQVRITTKCDRPSDWRWLSRGTYLYWTKGEGEHEILLPLIQDAPTGPAAALSAVKGGSIKGTAEIEVVVDADLARSVEVALVPGENGELRGAPASASVERHDVATVQWTGEPKSVEVDIEGVTPDGVARTVHASFRGPKSTICFLSLTPLEGGEITSFVVRGVTENVRAAIAPQLVR